MYSFGANIFKAIGLFSKFHQNRPGFVEDVTKRLVRFSVHSVDQILSSPSVLGIRMQARVHQLHLRCKCDIISHSLDTS